MTIEYKPTKYQSDLTDAQWEEIKDFFPVGNKSGYHKRSLVEAVLYLVDNGCKWRALPHDYPNWSTVKSFYYRAVEGGIWDKVMRHLVKITRVNAGRCEFTAPTNTTQKAGYKRLKRRYIVIRP